MNDPRGAPLPLTTQLAPPSGSKQPNRRDKDRQRESTLPDTLTALCCVALSCPETEYVVGSKPAIFIVALLSGRLLGRQSAHWKNICRLVWIVKGGLPCTA